MPAISAQYDPRVSVSACIITLRLA
jgi:hypothetical protein